MHKGFVMLVICLSLLYIATPALALPITLSWDANTEPNLAGYKIYYSMDGSGEPYDGVGIDQGNSPIDIPLDRPGFNPDNPQVTLTGLYDWCWFVVTAYNDLDPPLESGYSNEVLAMICKAHYDGDNNFNEEGGESFGCFISVCKQDINMMDFNKTERSTEWKNKK